MIVFLVICALLILVGLGFILPPLRHPNRLTAVKTMAEANAAVYRRQATELESDLRHGLITRAQFERDREELEGRAVADLPDESRAISDEKRTVESGMMVLCLAIGLPLAAMILYLALGTPPVLVGSV
jgi:cytochrome c-type biogenesis protein CcmH